MAQLFVVYLQLEAIALQELLKASVLHYETQINSSVRRIFGTLPLYRPRLAVGTQ